MPRFLYTYQQFFSYIGHGTPENPGGDFGIYCWIDAADAQAALAWGYVLLGDYYQKRFSQADEAELFVGLPIQDGWLELNEERMAHLDTDYLIPECKVGVVPAWDAPWRLSNLTPRQRAD